MQNMIVVIITIITKRDTHKNDNEDVVFWRKKGKSELEKAIGLEVNENVAKVRTIQILLSII